MIRGRVRLHCNRNGLLLGDSPLGYALHLQDVSNSCIPLPIQYRGEEVPCGAPGRLGDRDG